MIRRFRSPFEPDPPLPPLVMRHWPAEHTPDLDELRFEPTEPGPRDGWQQGSTGNDRDVEHWKGGAV